MAAGDSIVSICNQALIAIGEDTITSLNDARKAAILCSVLYDPTRRELLEMQPWKFAKKQVNLASGGVAPVLTYSNAYQLPADFIRMYDEPDQDEPEYEIMGGSILTDDDAPFGMLYIADVQDPTQFSPLFVSALVVALASKLAQPLTQSVSKENELAQKFDAHMDRAALANSQQESSREENSDVWLRSRW